VVTAQLENRLATASLSAREQRVVGLAVSRLREELDPRLLAVWLYGSRARGEADPTVRDPDRRSDVDLMVIVDSSDDLGSISWDVLPLIEKVADDVGDSPVYYSIKVYDVEHLRRRRGIGSFFFQEVDRDKIVLTGGALE
jgi:predicted nucleotidyltransferase